MSTTTAVFHFGDLFTAADRCDRCGAHASVLALLHGGGQLQFCGHHARVHRSALERVAACFDDEYVVRRQSTA